MDWAIFWAVPDLRPLYEQCIDPSKKWHRRKVKKYLYTPSCADSLMKTGVRRHDT